MFSVHPRRPQRLRQESPGPLPERGVQHRRLELRGDVPAGQVDDDDDDDIDDGEEGMIIS